MLVASFNLKTIQVFLRKKFRRLPLNDQLKLKSESDLLPFIVFLIMASL